ncbi:MAG TPA: tRNA (adenosine(37)-N6)-threonylcarbamoyltransferase complex transferase subunit TsaD [Thermodesulfovibrionia bacterium]|nr:tRNA (adenosine(37)-N6)-threonylcarbamoyltransferase complex transferase subunit TsaD [Thermodesulfovibrionia bacterium]
MYILGIDTSCDDTAASVVNEDGRIVSNVVSSQNEIHVKYGGIVPELASRRHIEMIWPVVDEALKGAGIGLDDIAAVAVCQGPGLIGSLLVGVSFAKSLCYVRGIPLIAVNHLEGHILAPFLTEDKPSFPFIALIVSGGHTHLYRADDFGVYKELGRTRDDAAGEAYDKVAKLLGLPYPGGPVIDQQAKSGNPQAIAFPRAYLNDSLDFSFSGLKTAVLNHVKAHGLSIADIAASFQAAVIDVLIKKVDRAVKQEKIREVVVSGGVAANSQLREDCAHYGKKNGIRVIFPPRFLCTDNAAMIGVAGLHWFEKKAFASLILNPKAYLPL